MWKRGFVVENTTLLWHNLVSCLKMISRWLMKSLISYCSAYAIISRRFYEQSWPHSDINVKLCFWLVLTVVIEVQVSSDQCETVSGHLFRDEIIVQLFLPVELVARQSYYSHVESNWKSRVNLLFCDIDEFVVLRHCIAIRF